MLFPRHKPQSGLEAKHTRRLEDEIRSLEARVAALEGAPAGGGDWSLADGVWHWNPDVEPASPHASDLYFPGSSWTGYTEWDPSATQTWDVDTTRRMGRGVATGNATVRWGGMYRAIPNAEFAFYTQVNSLVTSGASGVAHGLVVFADVAGAPTTADFRTCDITYASGAPQINVRARTWDAYNGTASATVNAGERPHPTHFRMRVNGSVISSDYGNNGVGWVNFDNTTVGFTPAYFGVAALELNSGVTSTVLYRYLKVFSGAGSSAYNANFPGRAMALPVYP